MNYARILQEGIGGSRRRVEVLEESDFKAGLLLVLEGIEIYRRRLLQHLKAQPKVHPGLIEALERTDARFVVGVQYHPEVVLYKESKGAENLSKFMPSNEALLYFKALKEAI